MVGGAMTTDQIAHFRTEGWLFQPGLLRAQVEALRDEVNQHSGWVAPAGQPVTVAVTGPWVDAEIGHVYTPVRDLADRSATWHALCTDTLGPIATQLLADDVIFVNATAILKPPSIGQTFPWHQDGAYYGPENGRYIIANVYLDDVTPDNGSLQIVPRTHDHLWPHDDARGKKAVMLPPDAEIIEPPAKAGDVCWFHLWTVHGSGPNHSSGPRRAVRVGYAGVPS